MGARVSQHVRANLVGYIALVVAVAGVPTAWALARNSVTAKQIAPKAVGASELKPESVKGPDVKEATLGAVPNASKLDGIDSSAFLQGGTPAGGDLTGALPNPSIANQAVNSAKIADDEVTGSDVNESSLDLDLVRLETTSASNSNSFKNATASCPTGKLLVGGGGYIAGGATGVMPDEQTEVVLTRLIPTPSASIGPPSGYVAIAHEVEPGTSATWSVVAIALCVGIAG